MLEQFNFTNEIDNNYCKLQIFKYFMFYFYLN